jgi:hypothetical protein
MTFKFIIRLLHIFLALSLSESAFSFEKEKIKIAIIDTHFCSEKIKSSKAIQITPTQWMSESSWPQECSNTRMDHGQQVLDYLLNKIDEKNILSKKLKIEITPLVVFDKNGTQTIEAWNKAYTYIEKNSFDFVLSSVGYLSQEKISFSIPKLPTLFFLATPRNEGLVRHVKYVYPQILAPHPQLILISEKIFDGKKWKLDPMTLYSKFNDIQITEESDPKYKGSSFAAPMALALFLNQCVSTSMKGWTRKQISQCVNKASL